MSAGRRRRRIRLDERLVELGLARSTREAEALVRLGRVLVNDAPLEKPGVRIDESAVLRLRKARRGTFVSRGGDKLAGALDALGIEPRGRVCLDIGASTGGFSDCLLQRGAARVIALDVGYGLLDTRLAADPRVRVLERSNARYLQRSTLAGVLEGEAVKLVTIDVSFISATRLLPSLRIAAPGAQVLVLVKPQFELPAERVEPGGVVRSDEDRAQAVLRVRSAAEALGYEVRGEVESPLPGAKGNREVFLWLL